MQTPRPPSQGYGPPYKGTGEQIFIKDSRTDWTISEGNQPITAAQALEAAGDEEYETRRQTLKAHNETLYRVGKQHRRTAKMMIFASLGLIAVGWIGGTILSHAAKSETITPPTATTPEMRVIEPSGASALFTGLGTLMVLAGAGGIAYGLYGSVKKPPYIDWRVPDSMNRPAYIRQQVEPYNEKLTPANPIPSRTRPTAPTLPGPPRGRPTPPPRGGRR